MELLSPKAMAEKYREPILRYALEHIRGAEEPEILFDECFMHDERTYGFMIIDKGGMYGIALPVGEDGSLGELTWMKV